MLFFGWAVGAIVLGIISDKFGRQKVLFPSLCSDYGFYHGVCKSLLDCRSVSICHRVFRGWLLHHNVRFGDWIGRAWEESAGGDPCMDLLHSSPPSACLEGLFYTKLAYASDFVVCTLHFYRCFLEVSMITGFVTACRCSKLVALTHARKNSKQFIACVQPSLQAKQFSVKMFAN